MGRRQAAPLTDHTWEHVAAREVSVLLRVGKVWLAWLAAPVVAGLVHWLWPQVWVAALGAACAAGLAYWSFRLTRNRDTWRARLMAPVSMAAKGAWLTWADLVGLHNGGVWAVWFVGGVSGCVAWSHWLHTHEQDEGGGFAKVFAQATTISGAQGAKVIKMEALPEDEGVGLAGVLEHPAGMTADEFAKLVPNIESAAGLPVGALTTTTDRTNGRRSRYALTNPLLLDEAQPWPGPSLPGASILEPVRVARHVNGRPLRVCVVNNSTQVMGKTGAGKSFGWTWNEAAETWTRPDAAMMIADATKDEQTVGPLREGMHRVEIERDPIALMLEGTHRSVKVRTRHLASRGLDRWAPGCGLKHLTVALEEAPDIVDLLDDAELLAMWLSDIKAGRSAGIRWLISLQRSTFDQLPTIVRAQLTKVCFGVEDEGDSDYGLSPLQQKRNCHPEEWGANHPGKCYAHLPPMSDELAVLEARTFAWGAPLTDEGARAMRAHAAAYPASSRPLDDITADAMEIPVIASSVPLPQPAASPVAAVPDLPDKETPMAPDDDDYTGMDDDLKDAGNVPLINPAAAGDWVFGDDDDDRPAMDPEEAMARVTGKLAELRSAGRATFGLDIWADVLEETGRSQAWLYEVMSRLEATSQIKRRNTRPRTWQLGQVA